MMQEVIQYTLETHHILRITYVMYIGVHRIITINEIKRKYKFIEL
jgi:hypothetical protein